MGWFQVGRGWWRGAEIESLMCVARMHLRCSQPFVLVLGRGSSREGGVPSGAWRHLLISLLLSA